MVCYHVSDSFIDEFSNFNLFGVWEGSHILDVLWNQTTNMHPSIPHADTQGRSATVFGLSSFLGIELMPRIRNWKDLKLFRPAPDEIYKHIDYLFSDEVDWELIETHYP